MKKTVAAMAMLWAATAASAAPVEKMSAAEFDRQFRCPETFASRDEQEAATADSVKWYSSHNKTATVESLVKFRVALLRRHHCDATLAKMAAASTEPPPRPSVLNDPGKINFECQVRAMVVQQLALRRDQRASKEQALSELQTEIDKPVFSGQEIPVIHRPMSEWTAMAADVVFRRPAAPIGTDPMPYYMEMWQTCGNNPEMYIKQALIDWTKIQPK